MTSCKPILNRWCFWFFLGNTVLFWLIGLNYIPTISWLDTHYVFDSVKTTLKIFAILAYLGHFALISFLLSSAIWLTIWIYPKRNFVIVASVLIATSMSILLILDIVTYKIYRFHLNGVIFDMVFNGFGDEVFGLSRHEMWFAVMVLSGLLIFEIFYAFCVWHYFIKNNFLHRFIKWIIITLGLCLYLSYAMIAYSSGFVINRLLIDVGRFLPLYTEVFTGLLPSKTARAQIERATENYLIQPTKVNSPLNYPLHALQWESKVKPLNLVVILIDTWRFDMLNSQVSPHMFEFAKKAWVFNNHFSGGNATGPGIFSLFYGMPSTYWTASETQKRGPLLLDELAKRDYRLSVFNSAELYAPPFHRTVFQRVPNLEVNQQPAASSYLRDKMVTKKFEGFIQEIKSSHQPFFSFLFYDGVHSYCSYDEDMKPFGPSVKSCNRMELNNKTDPTPYLNRYKNAVFLVDKQIEEVITILKSNHLLENTIVLITGDHGEEFNDNHQNYWGHASNFTQYQIRTPLIIYWPNESPNVWAHQTSHFDVAPTLMKKLLGCQNSPETFSLGKSLFDTSPRPYLIIGGYASFGVLEANTITKVSPTGSINIEKLNGEPNHQAKLNIATLQDVFRDLRKFYSTRAM